MKVTLTAWAKKRYDPAPSLWVLRKWVRNGELFPPPEIVGKTYYIDENARRLTGSPDVKPELTLVDRLKGVHA